MGEGRGQLLLGAGTGPGSCSAPPYRSHNLLTLSGYPLQIKPHYRYQINLICTFFSFIWIWECPNGSHFYINYWRRTFINSLRVCIKILNLCVLGVIGLWLFFVPSVFLSVYRFWSDRHEEMWGGGNTSSFTPFTRQCCLWKRVSSALNMRLLSYFLNI